MRVTLIIVYLFLSVIGRSQDQPDFRKIDNYALKTPVSKTANTEILATYLIESATTDLEKVRSFYTWTIHNIEYDNAAYKEGNKRINRNSNDVLNRRKAVCFGYATLFKDLCNHVGIEAEVVTGYSKGTLTADPNLTEADHAWNAVKVGTKWYLLDATWASSLLNGSDDFMATLNQDYFLTPPEDLVLNHLPLDPMWQLLDCPVPLSIFKKDKSAISAFIKETQGNCVDYSDSLTQYSQLSHIEKRLQSAARAYRFQPNNIQAKEYGQIILDYQGILQDKVEQLKSTGSIQEIIALEKEIIRLCEQAERLTTLYPNQIENCAYARIDYAVALSQLSNTQEEQKVIYAEMKKQTSIAKEKLETLPNSFLIQNALDRCQQILDFVK